MTHTPAPWKVNKKTATVYCIRNWGNSGTTDEPAISVAGDTLKFETALANAHLIAAAPDLLEAAQMALDDCVDLIATEAGNALEAAIKKAKGE